MKKRVLSGIRATGRLHLGNYLGAVKGMIQFQNNSEYECLYMVADAHTITTPYNPQELKINQKEIIIDYLAVGLNPEKSTLFIQSQISEHFELAYYFSSIVSIARMQHLPTYKEKVKQYPQNNTMALLNYPVLMAADILVYKADLVPVGIDQEPHLEVSREIARKMNQTYGTNFPEPKRFSTPGEYIPSLKGEGKMSKTVEGSYINLTDSIDEIRKKIRSIPTATISGGPITGGVKTLFLLAKLFLKESDYQKFKNQYNQGSLKFVEIKDAVAEAIYQELKPIQEKRSQIAQNKDYIEKVVKNGAEKAKIIASETLKEVKEKMGLI
ncbi:MAG: tryptophan--tRNA ligase [Patescibacteria group bacterium]|nr:tryptophan--tRNA ligase [Patescibacteria group bacterium]